MSKKPRRNSQESAASFCPDPNLRTENPKVREFKPMNETQTRYCNKIDNNTIIFATGPAGTGKTECAAGKAAEYLKAKWVDRIIISRPAIEACGEELGHLPGDINEKFSPYVSPLMNALNKYLGKSYVEALISNEKIVMLPLAFARGWTFERSFVILDEAQNVSPEQMKLFLTRIGKDSILVIDGDVSQKDLNTNGLEDGIRRLAGVGSVAVHRFSVEDVVRHGIIKDILRAYSDEPVEDDREGLARYLEK